MPSHAKQTATWASLSIITSALVFGSLSAVGFMIAPESLRRGALTVSGTLDIATFGIVHWLLLGLITLPYLLAPLIVWPWIARVFPSTEDSWTGLIPVLGILSAASVALRAASLEYPVLRVTPLSLFHSPYYFVEWAALWVGLLAPRHLIQRLRLGAFAPTRGAA